MTHNLTRTQAIQRATALIASRVENEGTEVRWADETPTGQPIEHESAKTVRLEWVGEKSPLESLTVQYKMVTGQYTKQQIALLRDAATKTTVRIPHVTGRALGRNDPGLSRDYHWGPHPSTFVLDVTHADAEKILSCRDAHEFRLVGPNGPEPESDLLLPRMRESVRVVTDLVMNGRGEVHTVR